MYRLLFVVVCLDCAQESSRLLGSDAVVICDENQANQFRRALPHGVPISVKVLILMFSDRARVQRLGLCREEWGESMEKNIWLTAIDQRAAFMMITPFVFKPALLSRGIITYSTVPCTELNVILH